MTLKELLKGIDYELIKGSLEVEIEDLSYDSRTVHEKMAFVALVGIDTDGHQYIDNAIENGCNCIIICKDVIVKEDITVVKIRDTRTQLSYLSANLFGNPGDKLIKIAITGTKGKTSTSWMIKNILESAQYKVGVIGTLGTFIDGVLYSHKNTTPESYQIQKFMRIMVDKGVKYLIMEASSQALKVGRINNIRFQYGIFTNLSIDHIGPREHYSFDDYMASKAMLFQQCEVGILNCNDEYYKEMIKGATCDIYTYGNNKINNLVIRDILAVNTPSFLGTEFSTSGVIENTYQVRSPGNFSAYNAGAATLLCYLLGIKSEFIKKGLYEFAVRGRCEIFSIQDKFKVVIDFAHNKISMQSILETMREYNPSNIITIFGCGGGRSSDRRMELGVVSGKLSDYSIITTDNPRNDDIDEINSDISKGIESVGGKYKIIKDRKEAILYAMKHANEGDIILLLGKGHETYQEIKGKRIYFNEKEIIEDFVNLT